MRGTAAILKGLLLSTFRNRQGFFWTLFFPVVIMFVFGLLGNVGAFHVNLAVAGPAGPARTSLTAALKKVSLFKVKTMGVQSALAAVQNGHEDAALVFEQPAGTAGGPLRLSLRYNNANALSAGQTVAAVESAVAGINVALSKTPPAFAVDPSPVSHSRQSTFLDFLLPGVLAMMAMQQSLFGIGSGLTRWKENGVLRRFMATPLRPVQFLGAAVTTYLIYAILSSSLLVAVAVLALGAHVTLPVIPILVVIIAGAAVFLSIGFIVSGVSKTQDATVPIINLISFPMLFLSGVFFPVSSLPAFLQGIVRVFPLTYLVDGLRGLMSGQATGLGGAIGQDLLGLAAWIVVTGIVASRTWRWS